MSTPLEPIRENAIGLLQRSRYLGALALLTVALGSCGTPLRHSSTPNTLGTESPHSNFDATGQRHTHVFVVVMENLSFSTAMQTASIRALALRYGYATNYYAIAHPSLPNYLALTSGSVQSVTTDCTNCVRNAPNIAESMSKAGLSWGAYLEDYPGNCFRGSNTSNDLYAKKHNPFIYYQDIYSSALCRNILPLSALQSVLRGPARLVPSLVWITPSMCHDGHDCSAQSAGIWLSSLVNQVTSSRAWRNKGVLYVTWDEGVGGDSSGVSSRGTIQPLGGGGHVLTLIIEAHRKSGWTWTPPANHFSLLRTVEANFHLPYLGNSASPALTPLP